MNTDALLHLASLLKGMDYAFTTVTPATHARVNARWQNARAGGINDVFGWNRPFRAEVIPPELFAAMQAAGVLAKDVVDSTALDREADSWVSQVRAATLHGQLFLHSAYPTAAADAVFFGPDSYRFASAIARYLEGDVRVNRAVDIGCGAGPGAVVVALARPEAEVLAVDINHQALQFTALNARLAGAAGVTVHHSDLLDAVTGEFDLIVANPPYLLDAHERTYRHGGGSFGEGLSLAIAQLAHTRLAPGGTLLLYTGTTILNGCDRFRSRVEPLLDGTALDCHRQHDWNRQLDWSHQLNWKYQELDPDVFGEELSEPAYADADRIAAVLLTVRRSL